LVLERLREDKYAEEDFRRFMFKVGYVCTIIKPATLVLIDIDEVFSYP
jgi:hypothetical protein